MTQYSYYFVTDLKLPQTDARRLWTICTHMLRHTPTRNTDNRDIPEPRRTTRNVWVHPINTPREDEGELYLHLSSTTIEG
uniref:Uncharacterized protein n=1 Tax=Timema bartmani TaxID=61472 RepID=A0A7R9IAU7_9NEOP|nr:unnamed protein product [Timema bartmani]